jgi:hypothetical protein
MLLNGVFFSMYIGPASHYQVDLTGTAEKFRLSGLPVEHTPYQVDLMRYTCRQVYLIVSG